MAFFVYVFEIGSGQPMGNPRDNPKMNQMWATCDREPDAGLWFGYRANPTRRHPGTPLLLAVALGAAMFAFA